MVDKYVKPSISNYNTNPPSDDGSEVASNEITWSGIKTKLTDPIKTLVDSMNTLINSGFDSLFGNAVVELATDTSLTTSHYGQHLVCTTAMTLTLLDGATAGSNFFFTFQNNDGSGNALTLGRNGTNINGAASNLTVADGEGGTAFCDGTNWFVFKAGVLDINGLTTETRFDPTADYIAYYDASASGNRKILTTPIIQVVNATDGAVATGSTTMPIDDTIPQITEGTEFITASITPKNTNNKLLIQAVIYVTENTNGKCAVALFQDATAGALAAGQTNVTHTGASNHVIINHYMTAGTTSSTTFRIRAGAPSSATVTFNGEAAARLYGGVFNSSLTITEIAA